MEKDIKKWTYEDFRKWYETLSEDTKQHIKNADVFLNSPEELESFVVITNGYEMMKKLFNDNK